MSKDRIGLPGIGTAATHLVWVLVGAPGPVQAACAAPDAASDTAPTSAGAARIAVMEFRKANLADMCCLLMLSVGAMLSQIRSPTWHRRRGAPRAFATFFLRRAYLMVGFG